MKRLRRDWTVRLVLFVAVSWSAAFAVLESYRTVRIYMNRPWTELQPSGWRLGSPPAESLGSVLDAIEGELGKAADLSFAAPLMTANELHYGEMWTAYLLPTHDVYPLRAEQERELDYRFVWGEQTAVENLELVAQYPRGSLYRLP